MSEFATEFARLNVDVVVALGGFAINAARRTTPDTPIVFLIADPIGAGVVTNLSRPGGNITGVSSMRLAGKWPELAKEALPALTRVGYLINPTNATGVTTLSDARIQANPGENVTAFVRGLRDWRIPRWTARFRSSVSRG